MNRTINHLGRPVSVSLVINIVKTAPLSRPLQTSQTRITIRCFSASATIKTGSKQDHQDHAISRQSPFASIQQLSKRQQFKQITPDRHLVNYLDTHQLGYCAKRKVSCTLILYTCLYCTNLYSFYFTIIRLELLWRENFKHRPLVLLRLPPASALLDTVEK